MGWSVKRWSVSSGRRLDRRRLALVCTDRNVDVTSINPWSRCIAASSIARRDRVQRRNLCTQHASHLLRMYTENRRATGWEHVVAEQAVGKSQCKLTLDFVTTQNRIHSVHKSDLVIVLSSSFMESMFLKR